MPRIMPVNTRTAILTMSIMLTMRSLPADGDSGGSRNSTKRELTRLCSRNCSYWSRLSRSMPPPAWRADW